MKPKVKITITEAEQLYKILKESGVSIPSLNFEMHQAKKKSLFERFYDRVGMLLTVGKSFAPNELKPFR